MNAVVKIALTVTVSGPARARPSAVHTDPASPQAGSAASASATAPVPSGVSVSSKRSFDGGLRRRALSTVAPVTVNSVSRTVL